MRRIDLLTFGSLILNDDHLALPVTAFAHNTWETGIARTINTAIFMTQLLESQKNKTDFLNYKFTEEEEKIYSAISQKIPGIKLPQGISLSEHMLNRLKKQLTEWLSQWPNVSDEFPAKIKFQQLLSMLLNSQNILTGSFPNYLLKDPAPTVLESMFGMLRIEMVIQSTIMKSQKDLAASSELTRLLKVARDSTLYDSNPFSTLTLKQILKINSIWTGAFTEWAFGTPDLLIKLVDANPNPVFNSSVREQFLADESKIIKEESLLISELAMEIKQHQDKIRQRFDKIKDKMSDTNALNLDEYLRVGTEHIQKLEKYKFSLSSSAVAVSAFIKTFLDFHGKDFPTWGDLNQKPLQEIKTTVKSLNLPGIKLPVMLTNTLRPSQTPKEISATPSLSSSSSSSSSSSDSLSLPGGTLTVTESLNTPLTVSVLAPLTTSSSEKVNSTPDTKKISDIITPVFTPTKVVPESSKAPETSEPLEILTESKKTEVILGSDINKPLRGSAQIVTASTVPPASPNNLEKKETVSLNTAPGKTPILEKSPSSLKVASIPQGSTLAKRASVFQQNSSSSSSSTTTDSTSSTRRESKVLNPKFEALKKMAIPITALENSNTATQSLIQTTKNKGFIGNGTTGSATTSSSSSNSSALTTGKS